MAPDIVCFNIAIDAHACVGDLRGGLRVLMDAYASSLVPTAATFAPLLHAAVEHAATDGLQVLPTPPPLPPVSFCTARHSIAPDRPPRAPVSVFTAGH